MKKFEKKINKQIQNQYDELIRPVKAFLTFVSQEHHERVVTKFKTKQSMIGRPVFHLSEINGMSNL